MRTKNIIAMLLSLVMLCAVPTVGVAGQIDITVKGTLDKASYTKGQTVKMDIALTGAKENPIAAADFSIIYDTDLLSVQSADKLLKSYAVGSVVKDADDVSVSVPQDGTLRVLFMDNSSDRSRSIAENGTLLTVSFTAKANIAKPEGIIKLDGDGDFCSEELKVYGVVYSVEVPQPVTQTPTVQNPTTPDKTPVATVKKPAKVKKVTAKSKSKKKVQVTWKKAKNAKKYAVKYSYKKNMKKAKTKTTKKLKITLSKLKSKKRIYIQVRGINGSKKGSWSAKKSVKVK